MIVHKLLVQCNIGVRAGIESEQTFETALRCAVCCSNMIVEYESHPRCINSVREVMLIDIEKSLLETQLNQQRLKKSSQESPLEDLLLICQKRFRSK